MAFILLIVNRSAIKIIDDSSTSSDESETSRLNSTVTVSSSCPTKATTVDNIDDIQTLTEEMVSKFQRRYEEGYDLPDSIYQKWLTINHPEANMPCNFLADLFPSASIPSPVEIIEDHSITASPESKELQSNSHFIDSNFTSCVQQMSTTAIQLQDDHQQPANKTNTTSKQSTTLLDKYLEPSKSKSHASTRAITTARVLTSSECLNIIREKK